MTTEVQHVTLYNLGIRLHGTLTVLDYQLAVMGKSK